MSAAVAGGPEVVVVDAGGANLGSVRYALERLGARVRLSADPGDVAAAPRLVLPGVGAAGPAMARLRERGLVHAIRGFERPLLGICLGMQLLFEASAEGGVECLGILPGEVRALRPAPGLRVPHMGWNRLRPLCGDPLLDGLGDQAQAYFVHAYAAPVGEGTLASCTHGETFAAAVGRGNVRGVQFHPERSSTVGARLLANFLAMAA